MTSHVKEQTVVGHSKLVTANLTVLSKQPLRGLLMLETDQGQSHIEIDEDTANVLLDEVLALFGVPRPTSK
jgi:hypothetical protein